jgi:hypothetical protein
VSTLSTRSGSTGSGSTGSGYLGTAQRDLCARQADTGLDALLAVVLSARGAMRAELQSKPPDRNRQTSARRQLLRSLEAYTAALTTRGLCAPPRLRDELALQRALVSAR